MVGTGSRTGGGSGGAAGSDAASVRRGKARRTVRYGEMSLPAGHKIPQAVSTTATFRRRRSPTTSTSAASGAGSASANRNASAGRSGGPRSTSTAGPT
jgi:hypothetical protein